MSCVIYKIDTHCLSGIQLDILHFTRLPHTYHIFKSERAFGNKLLKKIFSGTSLGERFHAPTAGGMVQSLTGELRSRMPRGMARKKKTLSSFFDKCNFVMAQKARFPFRMFRVLKFPHHPPICSLLSSPLSLSCLSPQGTSWALVRMPQFKHHTQPLQTATSVHSLGLGVHRLVDGPSVGSTAWGGGPHRLQRKPAVTWRVIWTREHRLWAGTPFCLCGSPVSKSKVSDCILL